LAAAATSNSNADPKVTLRGVTTIKRRSAARATRWWIWGWGGCRPGATVRYL